MIEVREVKTRKEKRDFIEFPNRLYKDNKNYVPPLYIEEKKIFNKDYLYYDTSEAKYYIAYDNKKVVGRISAILQHASNEKWNQKRVRFTRFDCIDNQDVANDLFKKVEEYARSKGMEEVVGPLGFSDLEKEGLLIDGFDHLSTFEEQYNYPYYQKLIENLGYMKEVDWIEHRLFLKEKPDEKLYSLSDYVLKRYNLKLVKVKNINKFIKEYSDQLFEILDKTYDKLYGTVPFTEGMKKLIIDNFKSITNTNYMGVIVNDKNEIVCFGIAFPGIGKALQKSRGHLTIPALFKVLKEFKKPETVDLGLVGVVPEYEMKGVASSFIAHIDKEMRKDNVRYAETNLNLETNAHIINQWKNFDTIQHKRRRCYIKKI